MSDLLTRRDIHIPTLVEWQHQIATKLRWKLDDIRKVERNSARQAALFDNGALPASDPRKVIRFDDTVYRNEATQSIGAVRLNLHLLGVDRVPLIDGNLGGEEFQCAVALDGLEEVDRWVRDVAKHPDSLWLPRLLHRFYPVFVARLRDGRIFLWNIRANISSGAQRRRRSVFWGELWARTTGGVFVMVQKTKHGMAPTEQLRAAL